MTGIDGVDNKADLERFVQETVEQLPLNTIQGLPEKLLPGAWQDAVLENGWANFGRGYAPARYRVETGGRVTLRGLVTYPAKGTAYGTRILTLPPGFQIAGVADIFSNACSDAAPGADVGRVDVGTAGELIYVGGLGPVAYLSLANIAFWVN